MTESMPARMSDSSGEDGFRGAFGEAVDSFTGGLRWLVAASGPLLLVALVAAVLFLPIRRFVRLVQRRMV